MKFIGDERCRHYFDQYVTSTTTLTSPVLTCSSRCSMQVTWSVSCSCWTGSLALTSGFTASAWFSEWLPARTGRCRRSFHVSRSATSRSGTGYLCDTFLSQESSKYVQAPVTSSHDIAKIHSASLHTVAAVVVIFNSLVYSTSRGTIYAADDTNHYSPFCQLIL